MDRNTIGERLTSLRGDRPQGEVAKVLGISQAALSSYECGTRVPRDDLKIRIADYYGVSVQDIFFA